MKEIEKNKGNFIQILLLILTLLGMQFNVKDLLNKNILYSNISALSQVFNTLFVMVTFILYSKVAAHVKEKIRVDYRMKLATQLVVNKKRHSA